MHVAPRLGNRVAVDSCPGNLLDLVPAVGRGSQRFLEAARDHLVAPLQGVSLDPPSLSVVYDIQKAVLLGLGEHVAQLEDPGVAVCRQPRLGLDEVHASRNHIFGNPGISVPCRHAGAAGQILLNRRFMSGNDALSQRFRDVLRGNPRSQ